MMRTIIQFILIIGFCTSAHAEKECWALSELKGKSALSSDEYSFTDDAFSNPMILCFDAETGTGSVSGDDTQLQMFGTSTLAGWGQNRGVELFEVYQIDRLVRKVLFTKSRIGTATLIPNMPDVVAAYAGTAIPIP